MTLEKFKERRAALSRTYRDRLTEDLHKDVFFQREVSSLAKFARVEKNRIIASLFSNPA